jgi:hypothetical protein
MSVLSEAQLRSKVDQALMQFFRQHAALVLYCEANVRILEEKVKDLLYDPTLPASYDKAYTLLVDVLAKPERQIAPITLEPEVQVEDHGTPRFNDPYWTPERIKAYSAEQKRKNAPENHLTRMSDQEKILNNLDGPLPASWTDSKGHMYNLDRKTLVNMPGDVMRELRRISSFRAINDRMQGNS